MNYQIKSTSYQGLSFIYTALERSNMTSIYVKAQSKADLNMRIARGDRILGTVYRVDSVDVVPLASMPHGCVVKIWRKSYGSTPIARTFGTWDATRKRVK
jgi:hypothetical protein